MSYAIFRSQPINTLQDLAQIGSHNKREKKAYKSNPNIKLDRSEDNIELVKCDEKYVKRFYELTKDYKKEHEERQRTIREDRKKSYYKMLNDARNVVADELLFTSDSLFFKDKSKEDILRWANTCMEFVYNDLGYTKEQVLHSTIHMDEKTPHIHCVVIPLVKKLDKRTNTDRYTISKKQYIKNNEHLSELQDKYHNRLVKAGFDLERGLKGSTAENINIREFKKMTKRLDKSLEKSTLLLNDDYKELKVKLNKSKPSITGKEVKIDKDTYQALNKFMSSAKKVVEDIPKTQSMVRTLEEYSKNFRITQRENIQLNKEVSRLELENEEIKQENNRLENLIYNLLQRLKDLFKKILYIGTDKEKDNVSDEIKYHYDNNYYNDLDLCYISKGTTKEREIFEHIGYIRNRNSDYKRKDDDFEISM